MAKKEIKLTDEQIKALAPYEADFGRAIRSGWATPKSDAAIERLRGLWLEITGSNYPLTGGCQGCIMQLLKDLGWLYFPAIGVNPEDPKFSTVKVLNKAQTQAAPKPAPQAKGRGKARK